MNNERRKELDKAIAKLDDALALVEQVREDEQEARDNLPENMQDSERADLMDETIYELEEIEGELDSLRGRLDDAKHPE